MIAELERQTRALALALNVGGLMNVQYAIKDGDIYVLEVNPRASRTVPFVAKVIGLPVAKIAARVMAGETLAVVQARRRRTSTSRSPARRRQGSGVPVRALRRQVDTVLGPEMKSTGEVMGLDRDYSDRLRQEPARRRHPAAQGRHRVRLGPRRRQAAHPGRRSSCSTALGFKVIATSGTQRYLAENGVEAAKINKVAEGRPHIVDAIKNGRCSACFQHHRGGHGPGRQPVAAAGGPLA